MYRDYESPGLIKRQVEELRKDYCCLVDANASEDEIIEIRQSILDLEYRLNLAYQDEEEN
mgnify:FL=1